jgi:hypothetical protein
MSAVDFLTMAWWRTKAAMIQKHEPLIVTATVRAETKRFPHWMGRVTVAPRRSEVRVIEPKAGMDCVVGHSPE